MTPGTVLRISSLLITPAPAVCNLDCTYCFYLDREADPYKELPARARPNCDVHIGHRSAVASHLCNISYAQKRRLNFDPVREEILPL